VSPACRASAGAQVRSLLPFAKGLLTIRRAVSVGTGRVTGDSEVILAGLPALVAAGPDTWTQIVRSGQELPLCSLPDSFSREQPIAAALRTLCPSTGLKLTPMGLGPSPREAVRDHGEDASHQSHAGRPGTRANSESWRTRCRYATPDSSRNFPHPAKPANSAHPTNSGAQPEKGQKIREAWRPVAAWVGHNRNQRRPRL